MLRILTIILPLLSVFHSNSFSNSTYQDERLQKAYELFQTGEYEKALARFQKLSGNNQLKLDARIGAARVYYERGKYSKAEDLLKQILKSEPEHPDALTMLGVVFKKVGRYNAARTLFQRAQNSASEHLQSRLELGIMQFQWGEEERAQKNLQYFLDLYRRRPDLTGQEIRIVANACVYLNRVQDANNLFYDATTADKKLWQAYVEWGRLFLTKYSTSDARGMFEDALKINSKAAEAHLGLALCEKTQNFEQARVHLERALKLNPNLVEAHNTLAEMDILVGDFDTALEKLDLALEISEDDLQARSLRAICFFFLRQHKAFQDEEARVLTTNAAYGDLYFQLADILSRRYLFTESVEFYRKALTLNPEHQLARAGLGTSLSRLGFEQEAKQELESAFKRDPYNKYVGNLLRLFDEFPNYVSHQSDDLIVRIHGRDDPVLSRYAVALARKSLDTIKSRYAFSSEDSIYLEIFPEHDDFAVRCFGIPGAQAFLGICFGNVVAMDSPKARSKGDFVWGETLWHEMVHVSHLRMTANRIPRWLAEGIAVYETSLANPHWSMNLDLPFVVAFKNDRLLPLKDLDSGFNRPRSPGQVTLSYFQASQVVEFIETEYGHEKLLQTFPKFKEGMTTPEVIRAVFNKEIVDFDEEFRSYVQKKYRLQSIDFSYDPKEVPTHSEELKLYLTEKLQEKHNNPFLNYRFGMYYKKEREFDKAIEYLRKAREDFPYFVEKNNTYKALAEIYLEQGEKNRALQELELLTARNGKDPETLTLLVEISLKLRDFKSAIKALKKMIYLTPFESEVHEKLASAYLAVNQTDAAIAELQINLLTQPPDVARAHCELANALLVSGRKLEAKKEAMAALEIAPDYDRAQEILLSTIE